MLFLEDLMLSFVISAPEPLLNGDIGMMEFRALPTNIFLFVFYNEIGYLLLRQCLLNIESLNEQGYEVIWKENEKCTLGNSLAMGRCLGQCPLKLVQYFYQKRGFSSKFTNSRARFSLAFVDELCIPQFRLIATLDNANQEGPVPITQIRYQLSLPTWVFSSRLHQSLPTSIISSSQETTSVSAPSTLVRLRTDKGNSWDSQQRTPLSPSALVRLRTNQPNSYNLNAQWHASSTRAAIYHIDQPQERALGLSSQALPARMRGRLIRQAKRTRNMAMRTKLP